MDQVVHGLGEGGKDQLGGSVSSWLKGSVQFRGSGGSWFRRVQV